MVAGYTMWGPKEIHSLPVGGHCPSRRTHVVVGIPKVSKAASLQVSRFVLEALTGPDGGTLRAQRRTRIVGLARLPKAHGSHERFSAAEKVPKLTRNKAPSRHENRHVPTLLGS